MDRNFIIAMVLMVLVLFAWQALFAPKPPLPDEAATTPGGPAAQATGTPTPAPTSATELNTPTPSAETPPSAATPPSAEGSGEEVVAEAPPAPAVVEPAEWPVKNERIDGALSNAAGGSVSRWKLVDYNLSTADKDRPEAQREKVNLALIKRAREKKKKEIPQTFADQPQLVCALDGLAELDGSRAWSVVAQSPTELVVERSAGDITINKALRLYSGGAVPADRPYNIDVAMRITNQGAQPASVKPFCAVYEQIVADTSSFFYRDYNQMMQLNYIDNDLEMNHISKVKPDEVPQGPTYWTGFADNYFATLVGPDQDSLGVAQARVTLRKIGENIMEARLVAEQVDLGPGQTKEVIFKAYIGPKQRDYIQAGDNGPKHHFDRAIDFGWFDIIARWLMVALIWLAKLTGNYGVAILILTVFIKILLFPLQHKSFKSMRQMQALQPEIAKLREQYKDNKEKMNQEMMALYRRFNVNPAGGCLPMLVQLPIFIAFYRALGYAIELRQTPFVWWLQDLSAQDPYYITPILMGASMWLSQKMTPTTGDPTQAKIMGMMPIIFTFLFLSFPAGLVLYWLTNNILSIVQQVITNRYLSGQEAAKAAAAEGK